MGCERKYSVYMHRNRFDDKKYFGITCRPLDKRWGHGLGYKKQSRFYNAILKYGWDEGFDHVILAVDLTEECAKDIERLLIAVFNTQNREFGYNLTAGGDENPMDCPELVAKKTESLKQYYENNPELREKVRQHNNLLWSNPDSIFYSSEYRKKQRLGIQNKFGKKVRCIETGETYNCLADAARAIGVKSHTAITICCNNPKRTAKGMHWQFA